MRRRLTATSPPGVTVGPVHCEIHRSPIAERGWLITLTDTRGGKATGWIGKRHRMGFLGTPAIGHDLRRAIRRAARELDKSDQEIHRFVWMSRA
jgi:hypothetical protein